MRTTRSAAGATTWAVTGPDGRTTPTDDAAGPRPSARQVAGVAVLLGLVGLTWFLTPQAFPGPGSQAGWQEPQPTDQGVLLDLGAYPDRDVALLQVRPRVSGGPASAVRVAVCPASSEVGAVAGPLPDGCRPVAGQRLRAEDDTPRDGQLVLAIDPVPGASFVVDGADVLYRDGLRIGYQHVGARSSVAFAPAG